jgi:glycyl-tRNA synthetase
MKYLFDLASSTAVVLNRKFQQLAVTQHSQAFVKYFSVNYDISQSSLSSDWGKVEKGSHNKKLQVSTHLNMADSKIKETPAPLPTSVRNQVLGIFICENDIFLLSLLFHKQGELIHQSRDGGAPELDVKRDIDEVQPRKKVLGDMELEMKLIEASFDTAKMKDLLIRHFFFDNSFTDYNCFTGQLDFGPMGCVLKNNVLEAWKKFFVLQEQMLKVECSIFTPEPLLT